MCGFDSLKERIIILPDAKMDYTPKQIEKFIKLWNEGVAIGDIAEKFWVNNYEIALLVMHCELEGWINPREGGLNGSLARKKRK
ncbi:hypothetical protein [Neobacillus sp. NPDC093127]|uniref:hypothetical protein n=1 Tax=Neobacillus sp. NPDC093127 TaxID=3364296 RepID=UPI0038185D12